MKLTTLEVRLLNVLRKNSIAIHTTHGKYKAALQRLVKKGRARLTEAGWELSTREMLR